MPPGRSMPFSGAGEYNTGARFQEDTMKHSDIMKRLLVVAAAILPGSPALADAIDGDWCSTAEVKHLKIEGPNITTPAGSKIVGNYSRHAFTYVVPDGERGAGEPVAMQLLNEEEVEISFNGAAIQVWRRCELTS